MAETQYTNIIETITKKPAVSARTFTEAAIMSMIFNDRANNASFYLLDEKQGDPLQNHIKFYDRYMERIASVQTITAQNKGIMDLDISTMLSQNAIKYLFFLDLLSELYYSYQKTSSTITVKCRYFLDEGIWKLYTRADFYNIVIKISLPSQGSKFSKGRPGTYNIIDLTLRGSALQNKEQMLADVKNMFKVFEEDINRHIGYLGKKDVQEGQFEYLSNIQGFYKFCRLKMLYYALKSVPDTPSKDILKFIDTQLIYLFINLKNDIAIKNPGYQNVSTTNKLLTAKKKLSKINEEATNAKESMRRNKMQSNKIKESYNRQFLYVCLALMLIFTLTTVLILNLGTLSEAGTSQVSLIIILITVCVYITMYYILYTSNLSSVEKFETTSFDKVFKFPLQLPNSQTKNTYNYLNDRLNKTIKISGSYVNYGTEFWHAFDGKSNTSWESENNSYDKGLAKSTYRNLASDQYGGDYLQIDLGEDILLKYFTISFNDNERGPQNYRLYASSNNSVSAPLSINHNTWEILMDVKNVKYPAITKRRFDLIQTDFDKYLYPQKIAAGRNFSVYVNNNEEAMTFGLNSQGQLGTGNNNKRYYPDLVILQASRPLKNVIQVSAGGFHTLFLTRDGFAYACGNNQWGQLGDTTTTTRYYPVDVRSSANAKLTNVVQVCAGHSHSMFLRLNKTVVGCGRNKNGQLGNGTTVDSSLPVTTVLENGTDNDLSNVIQVAAGVYSFCTFFLRSNGKVYKCGVYGDPNSEGETNVTKAEFVGMNDEVTVKISAAGGYCLCVTNDNYVWGIGQNRFNQLGNQRYTIGDTLVTAPVYTYSNNAQLTDIIDVAAGTSHSIFLKKNGTVMVCGKNNFGQLGTNNTTNETYPKALSSLTNVFQIAAGDNHSIFLINSGGNSTIMTCGFNGDGQIGAVAKSSIWMSETEECYSCLNSQLTAQYSGFLTKIPLTVQQNAGGNAPGPIIPSNRNNQTTTFINNYENIMYTSNINKVHRHFALVINKLIGTSATANRAQISEWELYGTYNNQTAYLSKEYNDVFLSRTDTLSSQKEQYVDQNRRTLQVLDTAITIENGKYAEWQRLVNELKTSDYTNVASIIPPNMDVQYYEKELPNIRAKIDTTALDNALLDFKISTSNTEIAHQNSLKSALNLQNVNLQIEINTLSGHISSFQSYKNVIENLQGTLQTASIDNNGILTEQQKTVLQSRIDETNAAMRLGAAQIDKSTKQTLLRSRENTVFEQANILANAKLEADKQNTLLQNEITTRQEILKSMSLTTAIDAEIHAAEIKRLEAQSALVAAKSVSEGAQIMSQSRMIIADDAKKLSDELQNVLLQRTGEVKILQNQTENLLTEMRGLDERIATIDRDTNAYVDRIERDTKILEIRREREKKWYEYQITLLQAKYAEVDETVRNNINLYQKSIDEDQAAIDDFIKEIQVESEEIVQIVVERQKYKYVARAVEVDASVITIQTKIMYNINNTATVIANSIVLTGMDKEYREMEDQKEKVEILEVKSDNDVEINKRDDKLIYATNKLLLNIMLAAVILIIIYHQFMSIYVLLFMVIVFCIIIAIYFIEVLQIVRTSGNKYYWQTALPTEFTDEKKEVKKPELS